MANREGTREEYVRVLREGALGLHQQWRALWRAGTIGTSGAMPSTVGHDAHVAAPTIQAVHPRFDAPDTVHPPMEP